MVVLAGLNALTPYGIQPIWSKGQFDDRHGISYEVWNPISKVRVHVPGSAPGTGDAASRHAAHLRGGNRPGYRQ